MRIVKVHDHPDKDGACYRVISTHPLTKGGVFRAPDGRTVYAGYMAWSGHWYLCNIETGRDIGDSVSREVFESFFEPYRIGDMEPDPSCTEGAR